MAEVISIEMGQARARLSDRGIDPDVQLGPDEFGAPMSVAGLYLTLGAVAASEKAGQGPTHAAARLALRAGLASEVADTLFLAYNQQSAEEAGHGDKVFGNAYYALGRVAHSAAQSVVGEGDEIARLLQPGDDPRTNKKTLGAIAAAIGGIETVALQRAFPMLMRLCERWDHPVARDLQLQIRDIVRPEESRHVLLFRYVFHQLIAIKGANVIAAFRDGTNAGRAQVGAEPLDHDAFARLVGATCPTPRQLLGKDRVVLD